MADLRRKAILAALVAVGVALPAATISAYVGARILTDAPRPRDRHPAHRARFVGDSDTIQLIGVSAGVRGSWGLDFAGGYARIGPVRSLVETEYGPAAIRPFHLMDGAIPAVRDDRRRGDRRRGQRRRDDDRRQDDRRHDRLPPPWPVPVYLSPYAFPDDPQILARRCGADWSVDAVRTPQGVWLPAWRFVPPDASSNWVIGIHGRGARRTELFRLMEICLRAGMPCLVVSYRTDAWTASPAPLTTLGQTEWEDVAAAVRHVVNHGAGDVVLAGCSLGGGIAAQVLRRSAIAPYVAGVILDSPALTWAPIVQHVARGRRLPGLFVPVVMAAARLRSRIDWVVLDHLAAAADFRHPILLIHGSADPVVPVWLSDALAEARPDLVTYWRPEGAGHVTAWNHDPETYERSVQRFLEERQSLTSAV